MMLDEDPLRQTGRTTRQIQNAPKGALFVWCIADTYVPRKIARVEGRVDLVITSPFALHGHTIGPRYPAVVVDHAARLSTRQQRQLEEIVERLLK